MKTPIRLPAALITLGVLALSVLTFPFAGADDSPLILRQASVSERYQELEKLLLRLADVEAAENPERAALLKRAVSQSRDKFILEKLRGAADSLRGQKYQAAVDNQGAAKNDLEAILKLLMSEDRSKRIRDEKERVAKMIKDLKRIERAQRSTRARTENGAEFDELESEQKSIADRSEKLNEDIQEDIEPVLDPSSAEKEKSDQQDSESQKDSSENKDGQQAAGEKSDVEKQDGKESGGEQSDGKQSDGKQDDGKQDDGKQSDSKKDEGADQKSDSESKPKDGDPSKQDDSESAQQKSSDSQQQKSEGQQSEPSQQQPSQSQQQQSQQQQSQQQQSQQQQSQQQQQQQQQPQSQEQQAQQELQRAIERMRQAEQELEKTQRQAATEQQREAEENLRKAIDRLEQILRQLREEEMQRELAKLESRLRKMAAMQSQVLDDTIALAATPKEQRNRQTDLKAGDLAFEEKKITLEADRAMLLLREEGSSVAFPEVIDQIRKDTVLVSDFLGQSKIDVVTQGVQKDILAALEEMIAALQQAQRELEQRQQQRQQNPQQAARPEDQPLVDALAELKLIRTMETRIKSTTDRYAGLLESGESAAEQILPLLQDLSERQNRLYRVTRDLVLKRNQ